MSRQWPISGNFFVAIPGNFVGGPFGTLYALQQEDRFHVSSVTLRNKRKVVFISIPKNILGDHLELVCFTTSGSIPCELCHLTKQNKCRGNSRFLGIFFVSILWKFCWGTIWKPVCFTTEMDRFACELCHPTKQNISRFNLNT